MPLEVVESCILEATLDDLWREQLLGFVPAPKPAATDPSAGAGGNPSTATDPDTSEALLALSVSCQSVNGIVSILAARQDLDADLVYLKGDSVRLLRLAWMHGTPGERAAELDTGNGPVASYLVSRHRCVVATDIHEPSVRCAHLTLEASRGRGRPSAVVRCDIGSAVRPGVVDLVVANAPWSPDYPADSGGRSMTFADGGPTGTVLPARFIDQTCELLAPGGVGIVLALDTTFDDRRRPLCAASSTPSRFAASRSPWSSRRSSTRPISPSASLVLCPASWAPPRSASSCVVDRRPTSADRERRPSLGAAVLAPRMVVRAAILGAGRFSLVGPMRVNNDDRMSSLETVAPAFVDMAHRIVWCIVATLDGNGRPRTRVLHPVWEWDGTTLTGWVATGPTPVKSAGIAESPHVSLTYWDPTQDTCTAECDVTWITGDDERTALWQRFVDAPAPVGYDPSMIPGWDEPTAPAFAGWRLDPQRLRVFPGTLLLAGQGELLTWRT